MGGSTCRNKHGRFQLSDKILEAVYKLLECSEVPKSELPFTGVLNCETIEEQERPECVQQ